MACWVTSKQANTTNLNALLVCLVAQSSALEMYNHRVPHMVTFLNDEPWLRSGKVMSEMAAGIYKCRSC